MPLTAGYFAVKLLAYAAWMFLGLRVFGRVVAKPAAIAALLGVLRLLMGLGFGFVIWIASSAVFPVAREAAPDAPAIVPRLATYLAVYVPVRWIEWGIFELVLSRESRSLRGFLLGAGSRARLWRAGGIAISCLADLPVIAAMGGVLPVGRFMC